MMTKGIEWLKEEIEKIDVETSENFPHYEVISKNIVLYLINQLDEAETLSLEWIDDNGFEVDSWNKVVNVNLQNLLVPKQEELVSKADELKPTVPQEWFDVIKMYKEDDANLWMVLYEQAILSDESDDFARAWLAYPNIEVEKPKHPILQAFDEKVKEYESYGSTSMRMAEVRKVLVEALEEEEE